MKYKRKPIVRDVVDAIKGTNDYIVQAEDGTISEVNPAIFERDYAPLKRERTAKPRKPRKPKDQAPAP